MIEPEQGDLGVSGALQRLFEGAALCSVEACNAFLRFRLEHDPGRTPAVFECGTGGAVTVEGGAFHDNAARGEEEGLAHAVADLVLHLGVRVARVRWLAGRLRLDFGPIAVTLAEGIEDDLGIWAGAPGNLPYHDTLLFWARDGQIALPEGLDVPST